MENKNCNLPRKSKVQNLKDYSKKVNWVLFILLSLFCISSWVSANSIWSELPFYINESPEGWRLTSILTALAQIAQILPMTLFLLMRHYFPKQVTYRKSIYFKLAIDVTACVLLSFFWNKTSIIEDKSMSLGLYILSFTISLLAGLSSMTFLPYIGEHFSKEYIVPLYIGESVSSTIPSSIVFFQGSTKPTITCQNTALTYSNRVKRQYFIHKINHNISEVLPISNVKSETYHMNPIFSVSTFFIIISSLMFIFAVAFVYVDIVYARKKAYKSNDNQNENIEKEQDAFLENTQTKNLKDTNDYKWEKIILLSISFFIACFMYGVLPGIQPYSTLPYSYDAFHLSINLGNLLLPIAVFSSIFSKQDTIKSISIQFFIALGFSLYLVYISIKSPCPPFIKSYPNIGAILSVFSWILIECVFIRLRCKIAERFEKFGGDFFLYLGFMTLLGQVVGGMVIYLCIDIYRLFLDKPPCATDLSYCF